jgi:uncharacterized protein
MENPFQFGRELGADELVNRREEVREVISALTGGRKLFLIGPRRYGRTSILKAAGEQAGRKGVTVLRYNAEAYPTLDLLVGTIVADAAKSLRGGVERAGEQIKKYFSKLRPELSFNVTQTSWSVKLGVASSGGDETQIKLLVDALNGLERMATDQPEKQPTGLVIDEFQKVIEVGGKAAEGQIRAAIQQHKRTGYVFAGSKTRMLTEMTTDAARPFYRLGSLLFVGLIPREEFIKFLLDSFVRSGFKVEGVTGKEAKGGAVNLILELAEEVPYNVQLLAHTCWEQLQGATGRRVLTGDVVRDSLDRVVRRYDPFYTQLWNQLTAVQQKTLLAVIEEGGMNLRSHKVVRAIGKGASTIQRALEALLDRDILREEEQRGTVRFRFEDPFFSAWIQAFTAKL